MTGALLAASVFAASSADATPSVFSAEDNVVYAISTICAPYALDLVERDGLPIGKGLVQPDGHDGLARTNPTGVRVGMAGFVHVTFVQSQDGSRSCDVQAKGADAQAVRRAALKALEGRPEQFAPMKSIYLPGRFASEDRLCASPTGPNPSAFIILSSTSPEQQGRIALLFTLHNGGARLAACDREGVPMNFRTLAPPQ
jgi:hypothetical protein